MTIELTGRGAAPGAALAPAFLISTATVVPASDPRVRSAEEETGLLVAALERTVEELEALAEKVGSEVGEDEGEIFEAHAEFANDPELRATAERAISDGANAEAAVADAFGGFRELLAASDSEYLAARADDLDDVRDRVIRILRGESTGAAAPEAAAVVVARELTPSQTASLPRELIAAIVTETGSPTSHAAILARALGIPAVVSCRGLLAEVANGVLLAVDGRGGLVLVGPDDEDRERFHERIRVEEKRRAELTALRDEPGHTADGRAVELAANIGSSEDLAVAVEAGAQGSGLVRTEFLFLDRRTAPTVDEQVAFYREVLAAFPGHRVVFRTMDVGADKPLPFVTREPEENPALGLRGIRLSLERPELLTDQLRALLRAHALEGGRSGRLAIMFPLVATTAEFLAARARLEEVAAGEGVELADIEVGVMVEVPSAALGAARLAEHADFLSIGTNDLLQYLFAADRLVGRVAALGDVLEPDVLALIRDVIAAGHAHHSWVGVCGEAASDPTTAAALVGLGIDELSMTRVAIPEVKDTLRRVTQAACREAVMAALDGAGDAAGSREIIETRLSLSTSAG